jgi:hypothetical protein
MPAVEQMPDVLSAQRFLFRDADWRMYQEMLAALGDRPVRLTYNRG